MISHRYHLLGKGGIEGLSADRGASRIKTFSKGNPGFRGRYNVVDIDANEHINSGLYATLLV
jgi:hypothetical protein